MAKSPPLPTDFDDATEENTAPVAALPAVEKDDDGTPYCAVHFCRMRQTSGGKAGSPIAYCKCPVEGCNGKSKRVKAPPSIIPAEPMKCPRCLKLEPQPIMERDDKASTAMYTILRCPCCGHKSSPLPRPEFVASQDRSRRPPKIDDVGAR